MSLADTIGVDRERVRRHKVPIAVLARERGVSRQTMRKAIYGITYQDCPVAPVANPGKDYQHPNRKLTDDQVRALRFARDGGVSWRKLGKQFGVSPRTAALIYSGDHYGDVE